MDFIFGLCYLHYLKGGYVIEKNLLDRTEIREARRAYLVSVRENNVVNEQALGEKLLGHAILERTLRLNERS